MTDRPTENKPARWPRGLGLIFALICGLILGFTALFAFLQLPAKLHGQCSAEGDIIQHVPPALRGEASSFIEKWELLPPTQTCRVYATSNTRSSPITPGNLIATAKYPRSSEYVWILLLSLLPVVAWLAVMRKSRTSRQTRLLGRF